MLSDATKTALLEPYAPPDSAVGGVGCKSEDQPTLVSDTQSFSRNVINRPFLDTLLIDLARGGPPLDVSSGDGTATGPTQVWLRPRDRAGSSLSPTVLGEGHPPLSLFVPSVVAPRPMFCHSPVTLRLSSICHPAPTQSPKYFDFSENSSNSHGRNTLRLPDFDHMSTNA